MSKSEDINTLFRRLGGNISLCRAHQNPNRYNYNNPPSNHQFNRSYCYYSFDEYAAEQSDCPDD